MNPEPCFADRLASAVRAKKSVLVVGLDPLLEKMPQDVVGPLAMSSREGPGFAARAALALGLFSEGILESVAEDAVAVKPNTAFFERFGAAGWDVLEHVARKAKALGLLVIADAKRGDIGHTAEAYADALLGDLPGTLGPSVDAVTVQPYLGRESLEPFLRRVREAARGIFVLVRTSNPGADEIQGLDSGGMPLYLRVAACVERWGGDLVGASGLSSVGVVVGATAPADLVRVRKALPRTWFLVPGYGAQGGKAADLRPAFLPGGLGAIVNASRSIIFAHESRGGPWKDAVRAAAREAREELERVRQRA